MASFSQYTPLNEHKKHIVDAVAIRDMIDFCRKTLTIINSINFFKQKEKYVYFRMVYIILPIFLVNNLFFHVMSAFLY
jgi:hypothetical protein